MAQRRLPVSLIVACSVNRVIGKQGKLPWNLPADWAFFSSTTQSQVLVVGRRSFEEFDEPIPNRHTIVVSSTLQRPEIEAAGRRWSGIQVVRTLEQALQLANTDPQYRNCNRVSSVVVRGYTRKRWMPKSLNRATYREYSSKLQMGIRSSQSGRNSSRI
ncbi:Dihydrofolate reductase-like domain [Phytophthora cactorum]|nr:Dihydrofolate reductase-like domain [Phytophthora cactorum]